MAACPVEAYATLPAKSETITQTNRCRSAVGRSMCIETKDEGIETAFSGDEMSPYPDALQVPASYTLYFN